MPRAFAIYICVMPTVGCSHADTLSTVRFLFFLSFFFFIHNAISNTAYGLSSSRKFPPVELKFIDVSHP